MRLVRMFGSGSFEFSNLLPLHSYLIIFFVATLPSMSVARTM